MKKVYLDGHCAKCKLLRLKMSYTASRIEDINKFEAHQQIKKSRNNEWEDTDESLFLNCTTDGPKIIFGCAFQNTLLLIVQLGCLHQNPT